MTKVLGNPASMSDEEFEAQTLLYSGHQFTTFTGQRIRINEKMTLKEALRLYKDTKQLLETAERTGHFIRSYEENQDVIKSLRYLEQVYRAQCMAAFCRAVGCWPKDAKEALGL